MVVLKLALGISGIPNQPLGFGDFGNTKESGYRIITTADARARRAQRDGGDGEEPVLRPDILQANLPHDT